MKYPIGIQDFEDLQRNGYAYVDKTNFVYKLADEGKYYFLSRPRRFGKSLFLSTLEAYFQGKKELFEGLAIYDLETEWKKYPIFHIDLNTANFREKDSLYTVLNDYLTTWECKYGARESEATLALRFKGVIARAAEKEGCGVVILIDEYDKPHTILHHQFFLSPSLGFLEAIFLAFSSLFHTASPSSPAIVDVTCGCIFVSFIMRIKFVF
jgi:hypothetical protein